MFKRTCRCKSSSYLYLSKIHHILTSFILGLDRLQLVVLLDPADHTRHICAFVPFGPVSAATIALKPVVPTGSNLVAAVVLALVADLLVRVVCAALEFAVFVCDEIIQSRTILIDPLSFLSKYPFCPLHH